MMKWSSTPDTASTYAAASVRCCAPRGHTRSTLTSLLRRALTQSAVSCQPLPSEIRPPLPRRLINCAPKTAQQTSDVACFSPDQAWQRASCQTACNAN